MARASKYSLKSINFLVCKTLGAGKRGLVYLHRLGKKLFITRGVYELSAVFWK